MTGPYVHQIDPILGSIGGVHLWWYGLSYALGFLNAHRSVMRHRHTLGLAPRAVYVLSLMLAAGVLLGGRLVEVLFYEAPFYREHPLLIPAYWLGGMATHGLIFGGVAGLAVFCRLYRQPFLRITDALAIPAAFILGMGRIGNFIDGQIVGSVTSVAWAVKFPDAEGFRHAVVLYDGLKNFLLIPVLWAVARATTTPGVRTGWFLFLYAFLRIFVDVFREYPTTLMGLATGQTLNLVLSALGLVLLVVARRVRSSGRAEAQPPVEATAGPAAHSGLLRHRLAFAAVLLFSLVIPSDWTQDIPARYGKRHPGLEHSRIYPRIDTAPR